MHDVFLSHATEDKEDLVRPLALELERLGLDVWYDESALQVGDSVRRSIDTGLNESRFAVVVLSRAFFVKSWANWELNGLVQRNPLFSSRSGTTSTQPQ